MTRRTMTTRTTATSTSTPPTTGSERRWTRRLLACGALAGPLFGTAALLQILTRNGFDLTVLAISALSLGDLGWIQIANFVVTGLLTIAGAAGLRRSLHAGSGRLWGPVLIGIGGVALIASGVFVTDPAFGFPAGAPSGMPEHLSPHAVAHSVATISSFVALVAAALVFARRFAAAGRRGWAVYSAVTAVAALAVSMWNEQEWVGVRLAIGAALIMGWTSLVAARTMSEWRTKGQME